MLNHLLIYLFSFAGIWIGSGVTVRAVGRAARTLKISSFMISFLILGVFTSVSEMSVGINSILHNDPEIFVGNLIGASIVLFMLIIPLLAIAGRSIRITPEFQGFNLPASLVVIAVPAVLALDGVINKVDSVISISLFSFLLFSIQAKKGIFNNVKKFKLDTEVRLGKEVLRVLFGVLMIFFASRFAVEETLYFADILKVSPFLISLIVIGIGTNIPELSLVLRSVFMKNHQVAFGDYVGSAAFNTFLLGALTWLYGSPVLLTNSYVVSLMFLVIGLLMFFYFARTKNSVSRFEGLLLLLLYAGFLIMELGLHRNLMFWK